MIDLCRHYELNHPPLTSALPPSLGRLLRDLETVLIRHWFSCPVEMYLHRLRYPSIPGI